jgi:hypothetical protein
MHKVIITLAAMAVIVFAGALTYKADAATWSANGKLKAVAENMTPIHKVACGAVGGRCPLGTHWVCGAYGRCACVRC